MGAAGRLRGVGSAGGSGLRRRIAVLVFRDGFAVVGGVDGRTFQERVGRLSVVATDVRPWWYTYRLRVGSCRAFGVYYAGQA